MYSFSFLSRTSSSILKAKITRERLQTCKQEFVIDMFPCSGTLWRGRLFCWSSPLQWAISNLGNGQQQQSSRRQYYIIRFEDMPAKNFKCARLGRRRNPSLIHQIYAMNNVNRNFSSIFDNVFANLPIFMRRNRHSCSFQSPMFYCAKIKKSHFRGTFGRIEFLLSSFSLASSNYGYVCMRYFI